MYKCVACHPMHRSHLHVHQALRGRPADDLDAGLAQQSREALLPLRHRRPVAHQHVGRVKPLRLGCHLRLRPCRLLLLVDGLELGLQ